MNNGSAFCSLDFHKKLPCVWDYLRENVPLGFAEHEFAAKATAFALIECFEELEDSPEPVDAAQRVQDYARKIVELLAIEQPPAPTQYLLTEEEYKEAEFLPVDFCDRGLIEVSYHCLSTKCVYGATLTVSQYNEWKEDARRACHHLNPCRYQTPMSPEKAFAQWLANDEAIGQLQEYVTRLCAQRMGCEFHLSQFYRQQEERPERYLIAHGGEFYCLEFDTEDGRIMRIERLPFLSKEKAPGVQQSEA